MDIFSQNKVLIQTTVVLVALNLALIGFFIFKEMRPQREPDFRPDHEKNKELSTILKKKLNLTNQQVIQFEEIRAQNESRKSKLKELINHDKKLLNIAMFSKSYSKEKVFALAKKISNNEYQIEIAKINQSQQLKAICNPEQLDKFEILVIEIQDYLKPKINKPKTMKNLQLLLVLLYCNFVFAHNIDSENQNLKQWKLEKNHKLIEGSFMMIKDSKVFIEDINHNVLNFPIASFCKEDQEYASKINKNILAINSKIIGPNDIKIPTSFYLKYGIIALFLLFLASLLFNYSNKKKLLYLLPIMGLGVLFTLFSFAKKAYSTTDPLFVASAFAPFATTVSTTFDANFFYVNSTGIPNHTMMVGIANNGWQQQVPISKCYINASHWTIPLNPVIAATPVPVSAAHFTRGAIAMATNGVPIFNPYTNTGADAFLTGQLDNFGGHCGRGDDYHYHTAPLHLITSSQTTSNLPIAFGFDGFAVYGSLEPDGSTMATLDANHGHFGSNGVYHYHGTPAAPYMIGKMVGVVTEDASLQIIPQPQGNPVRTENWTPLPNALITSCVANANNGYNTSYLKNGVSGFATNYTATSAGLYTFQYVTPTGTTSTNYNGPALCVVPNLNADKFIAIEQNITIYPNPATDILKINLGNVALISDVQNIYIYDLKGSLVSKTQKFESNLDIKNLSKGTYFVKIQFSNSVVTKKLLVK